MHSATGCGGRGGGMTLNDYALLGYLVSEIAAMTGSCTIEHESAGGPAVRSGEGHRREDRRPGGTVLHAAEVLASQLGIALPRPARATLPEVLARVCTEVLGSDEEGGL